MALMITQDCTGCDACLEPCPNEAISFGEPIYTAREASMSFVSARRLKRYRW